MRDDKIDNVVFWTLLILFCSILFGGGFFLGRYSSPEPETIEKHDTTYIHSVDTLTVHKDSIVYRDRIVIDTFHIRDTFLIREQLTYEDSLSQIWVSGINPSIDSIKHFIPRDTVVITNNITHIVTKKHGWTVNVCLYGGYGGCMVDKRLYGSPEVGIGMSIGYGFIIK